MEKIVKLEEFSWVSGRDAITIALCNTIIRKQNEIIDYLNAQPQAEEKTKLVMPPSAYEQAEEDGFNMKNKVKSELLPGSTPEQKEEWGKELGKLIYTWGKVLFVNEERIGVGMQPAMYLEFYHFIKNLLSEREREAEKNLLKRFYNVTSKEEFRDVLDKLNK